MPMPDVDVVDLADHLVVDIVVAIFLVAVVWAFAARAWKWLRGR
jgi:hypothetical protein